MNISPNKIKTRVGRMIFDYSTHPLNFFFLHLIIIYFRGNLMDFSRNQRLLLDLKNSNFVPMFNVSKSMSFKSELFDQITAESRKCIEEIREANS